MNTNSFKVAAMLLMLAGSLYSCRKKSEAGGEVSFQPCSCNEEKPLAGIQFPQGDAYLFKDSISEEMLLYINKEESDDTSRAVCWIVFDSETGNAELTISNGGMLAICEICNYPDFALEWNIPNNGCKVYWKGITYVTCAPKGGIATVTYFDLVLTNFKRK